MTRRWRYDETVHSPSQETRRIRPGDDGSRREGDPYIFAETHLLAVNVLLMLTLVGLLALAGAAHSVTVLAVTILCLLAIALALGLLVTRSLADPAGDEQPTRRDRSPGPGAGGAPPSSASTT